MAISKVWFVHIIKSNFPQQSMFWIYLISEGVNVTWGKMELIAVCTSGVYACRNR